jgi:putative transposase
MDGSIVLSSSQRKRLLEIYRGSDGKELHHPQVRLRAHIILLLADGHPWSLITLTLFCSSATIARWKDRFESGGVDALLRESRGRRSALLGWMLVVVLWIKSHSPRTFGYYRSRWSCATIVLALKARHGVKVSAETVRRWLHAQQMVWRRPRPVLAIADEQRPWKLRKIRELLRDLPDDEAAVFQDEVDINLNPDIGCMWMERGKQTEVVTPGNNVKRYLAGSMSWRSGELVVTHGTARNAQLFVNHLDDLRCRFRRYKKVHVICDNARFHTILGSRLVRKYLEEHSDRIVLHYLPAYSPKDNPIERVWWHLHEQITRNHQCHSMHELLNLTMGWLDDHGPFEIEGAMYERLKAVA